MIDCTRARRKAEWIHLSMIGAGLGHSSVCWLAGHRRAGLLVCWLFVVGCWFLEFWCDPSDLIDRSPEGVSLIPSVGYCRYSSKRTQLPNTD